jgi:hypothetical protein
MAHKILKDQLLAQYKSFMLMNNAGRKDHAERALARMEAIINGINPSFKAVNIDNLKQQAK